MASTNRLDTGSWSFLCFVLSFTLLPVGFGGNSPVPLGLAQVGLAASAFFLSRNCDLLQATPFFSRLQLVAMLMVGVLIWAIIQIEPFVPVSWAHPLWNETSKILRMPVSPSISIVPENSVKGLFRLMTYISGGILAYVFAQDSRRARFMVTAFWAVGTAICLYGLLAFISGSEKVLWYSKTSYLGDLTGTFINRNHFALFAGLVFIAGLALMFQSWNRMMRGANPRQKVEDIRDWVLKQGLLRLTLSILTFIAIVLTHSRAGLVCTLLGLSAYLLLYQIYLGSWMRAALTGILVILIGVIGLNIAFNFSQHFSELFEDYSSQERAKVYEICLRAFLDNPVLGYGLNGFEPEFRLYQTNVFQEFDHAHSDLLESILDLGVVGALALWSAVAILLSCLWHGVRTRRQDGMYPMLALAASVMILLHSAVDFDLQIPGLALTWTSLLGIGLAQSWPKAERQAALKSPA